MFSLQKRKTRRAGGPVFGLANGFKKVGRYMGTNLKTNHSIQTELEGVAPGVRGPGLGTQARARGLANGRAEGPGPGAHSPGFQGPGSGEGPCRGLGAQGPGFGPGRGLAKAGPGARA